MKTAGIFAFSNSDLRQMILKHGFEYTREALYELFTCGGRISHCEYCDKISIVDRFTLRQIEQWRPFSY